MAYVSRWIRDNVVAPSVLRTGLGRILGHTYGICQFLQLLRLTTFTEATRTDLRDICTCDKETVLSW